MRSIDPFRVILRAFAALILCAAVGASGDACARTVTDKLSELTGGPDSADTGARQRAVAMLSIELAEPNSTALSTLIKALDAQQYEDRQEAANLLAAAMSKRSEQAIVDTLSKGVFEGEHLSLEQERLLRESLYRYFVTSDRGAIGIHLKPSALGGILITELRAGFPANDNGLLNVDDRILSVNGTSLGRADPSLLNTQTPVLLANVVAHDPGDVIRLEVARTPRGPSQSRNPFQSQYQRAIETNDDWLFGLASRKVQMIEVMLELGNFGNLENRRPDETALNNAWLIRQQRMGILDTPSRMARPMIVTPIDGAEVSDRDGAADAAPARAVQFQRGEERGQLRAEVVNLRRADIRRPIEARVIEDLLVVRFDDTRERLVLEYVQRPNANAVGIGPAGSTFEPTTEHIERLVITIAVRMNATGLAIDLEALTKAVEVLLTTHSSPVIEPHLLCVEADGTMRFTPEHNGRNGERLTTDDLLAHMRTRESTASPDSRWRELARAWAEQMRQAELAEQLRELAGDEAVSRTLEKMR